MFDIIGRILVYIFGGMVAVSPAMIALTLAGGVPDYAVFIVGVTSAFAGAGGFAIMSWALDRS